MPLPSPRTYLLTGGALAATLLGSDLVRLLATGRLPSGELRRYGFTAAGFLAAVGLSTLHTRHTLDLARRMERARTAASPRATVIQLPRAARH